MPTSPYIFDTGSATHSGQVRSRNEDSHLLRPDAGLWAVADGMGGHEAGDLASQLIVKALDGISEQDSAAKLLEETKSRIFLANQQIIDISRQRGGAVIGSTVAVLLISEDHYACLWAGDSRLYLVTRNTITQISRDHTEVEEMLASRAVSMEEARHWPQNVITKAVGVWENPELEIVTGAFEDSDIFILCSDGLTKHVSDDEIMQYVSCRDAQAACSALVDLALDRGGVDNVTVVVVRPIRKQTAGEHGVAADEPPSPDIWESS
jgi:serine/threonine protein phosphatase PrpC